MFTAKYVTRVLEKNVFSRVNFFAENFAFSPRILEVNKVVIERP
jgi:hypothetical protein